MEISVKFFSGEEALAAQVVAMIAASTTGNAKSSNPETAPAAAQAPEPPSVPEPEPEQEREAPKSRPRKSAKKPEPKPDPDPEPEQDERDEPVKDSKPVGRDNTEVTHDDVRDLMADVIDGDDATRGKILKQLGKLGVKSVGAIEVEDLPGFYLFLESLKRS